MPVEISIINNRAKTQSVHLKVTNSNDVALVDTRLEVRPSGSAHRNKPYHPSTTVQELFTLGTQYRLDVTVEGEAATTTQVTVDCPADEGGEQWGARLLSGGGILVHDSFTQFFSKKPHQTVRPLRLPLRCPRGSAPR